MTLKMAAKEIVEYSDSPKDIKYANFEHAKQHLDLASEQLVFRQFEGCIKTCERGILKAKLELNGNPDIVEALCLVGIQAYAELNEWQQVLPFVQKVYGSIEVCPFRVIQLCLLLHAKVEEYSQCYAVASIWLKDIENFTNPDYFTLVELYITKVLVPNGQQNLIEPFVESCPGLSPQLRKKLCQGYVRVAEISPKHDDVDSATHSGEERIREKSVKSSPTFVQDSWLLTVIKNVKFAIFGNTPLYSFKLIKLTIIAVFLYLISLQHQRDFVMHNFAKVGVLFEGVVKVFKSLFGPRSYITR